MKYKNKAFTLVELIVTITIVIILGTISFISLQSYGKDSRDSVRLTDLSTIRSKIEIGLSTYSTVTTPDLSITINNNSQDLWDQGIFGDNNVVNLGKFDKKPIDPLTSQPYIFSKTKHGNQYELGAILENGFSNVSSYIIGNYNQKFLFTKSGGLDYVYSVPSLITSNESETDLQTILSNDYLTYNGFTNLPFSYNSTSLSTSENVFSYNNSDLLIYTGSLSNLSNNSDQYTFFNGLKNSYSGTTLHGYRNYNDILTLNLLNPQDLKSLMLTYSQNNYGLPSLDISY